MGTLRLVALFCAASAAFAQQPSSQRSTRVSAVTEPKLPVIDYDACPGNGRIVQDLKIRWDQRVYGSLDQRRLVTTVKAGEKVTVIGGANVVRQPGRALIKYVSPNFDSLPLRVGDTVLVYGTHADGNVVFWAKGAWFEEYYEAVAVKGSCGFTLGFGLGGCSIDISNNGVMEWWVQVKKLNGTTGWALSGESYNGIGDNFDDLCRWD